MFLTESHGQHGGSVVSTVASQQEGPGFASRSFQVVPGAFCVVVAGSPRACVGVLRVLRVSHLLALSPLSKKALGSRPGPSRLFQVLSVWSLHGLPVPAWVSSGYSGFPHHHKDMHCINMNECWWWSEGVGADWQPRFCQSAPGQLWLLR